MHLPPLPLTFPRVLHGAALLLLIASIGCASYRVGTRSLFPPDVQTVYVPMFESSSFRRGLGERLTEAVMKEIELRTPFKVVGTPPADSVLTGRLISDLKGVTVEASTDEPRQLQLTYAVQVSWVDRRGEMLRPAETFAMPDALTDVSQTVTFVPETGQSMATAQQEAIERLARQIVAMMETPW